jgi:hypothetical protein
MAGLRSHRRWLIASAALGGAVLIAGVAWTLSDRAGRHGAHGGRPSASETPASPTPGPAPRGRPVTVDISTTQPGTAVPAGFLGLSFETVALPDIATYARSGELGRLLRSLGSSGTLRLGGVTADKRPVPRGNNSASAWESRAISRRNLAAVAALARQTGWKVLLTVDLGRYDPAAAAQEAAAAHVLLGPKLAGIEIGNEPDRFPREGLRPAGWGFAAYAREFGAYRTAIARAAPGVAIAGPDASSGEPVLPWLRASTALRPSVLTDHYYPLTSCGYTPVVSELLSQTVRRQESSMLRSLGAIQRSSAIALQLDESNDISCKGQPGVSNSFASALWAADFVARAMAAGIRGVDFHDLLSRPGAYSPLVARARRLHANPEWYALLLAHHLQGSRPLATAVRGDPDLSARAFLTSSGAVQIMLVNFGALDSAPLRVRLRLSRRFAGGTIVRLTAPSPSVTEHVKLGGREVTPTGTWTARLPLPGVFDKHGSLALAMPPSGAALVTLEPATRAHP